MSAARNDASFDSDGTLWSTPAPFDDPLSGSATSDTPMILDEEYSHPHIPQPVQPDAHAVRHMVNAVMGHEAYESHNQADQEYPQETSRDSFDDFSEADPPLGMLPQQQTWPVRKVLKTGRGGGMRTPRSPSGGLLGRQKMSAGTAGIIVALTLMIIFAIVALAFLGSFFGSIGSLFS